MDVSCEPSSTGRRESMGFPGSFSLVTKDRKVVVRILHQTCRGDLIVTDLLIRSIGQPSRHDNRPTLYLPAKLHPDLVTETHYVTECQRSGNQPKKTHFIFHCVLWADAQHRSFCGCLSCSMAIDIYWSNRL